MEKLNYVWQLKYVVSKTVEKGYNNMNINPTNAENISAVATNQDRPEHRDPIEELNPISLLKKPGTSSISQISSSKPSFPWLVYPPNPSRQKTTNGQLQL